MLISGRSDVSRVRLEARTLLRAALTEDIVAGGNLADVIRSRFQRLGGVELRLPTRQPMREPPKLAR